MDHILLLHLRHFCLAEDPEMGNVVRIGQASYIDLVQLMGCCPECLLLHPLDQNALIDLSAASGSSGSRQLKGDKYWRVLL